MVHAYVFRMYAKSGFSDNTANIINFIKETYQHDWVKYGFGK